ncbi:MAG TPA: VOC family protein [Symbiobacteriaceae bacterium]|jgi:hypothetical protein
MLDHVVHAVRDLEAAASELRRLGLHVVPGGDHPGWGTRNALCYFDLTYIELIAVRAGAEAEAAASDFGGRILGFLEGGAGRARGGAGLDSGGDGLATAALRTGEIAGAAAAMQARGVGLVGPNPGSRRRPDGSVIAWQLALPPWPWPFLIQWGDGDTARRADLTARSVIREHPLGPGLRLRQVGWAVADLATAGDWLASAYGIRAGEPYADPALGAVCRETDAGLLLCEPTQPGPARERLTERGEGPFLYDLTAPAAQPFFTPVLGAWLRVVPSAAGE